jgi:putative membrane protein
VFLFDSLLTALVSTVRRIGFCVMTNTSPDVGYTSVLANERTYLAWIRTSLGLIAGGVALDQFVASEKGSVVVAVIAFIVIALGAVVALIGIIEWNRTNSAMDVGNPIPRSPVTPLLGIAVMIVAVAIGVALLMESVGR